MTWHRFRTKVRAQVNLPSETQISQNFLHINRNLRFFRDVRIHTMDIVKIITIKNFHIGGLSIVNLKSVSIRLHYGMVQTIRSSDPLVISTIPNPRELAGSPAISKLCRSYNCLSSASAVNLIGTQGSALMHVHPYRETFQPPQRHVLFLGSVTLLLALTILLVKGQWYKGGERKILKEGL
jgi:hypothetical protein